MSDNVIKEFLVALGYKIDEQSFKRFVGGIDRATRIATGLGVAVQAAATVVVAGVSRISKNFEELYYASQRLHDTVANIRAVEFGFSQAGGSAAGARAAMENIAEFMRSNPGGENFIKSLGVQTREANGELRGTTEIMRDLAKQFRAMPYFAAKVRAGVLGIDERTLQAMIRGTDQFSDSYHEMAKRVGVDQEAAARASHEFMVDLRNLLALITLTGEKLLIQFQPVVREVITWMIKLDETTDGVSTTFVILAGVLTPVVFLLRGVVAWLFQAIGGFKVIAGAAALLSTPVGWILALVAAIGAALASSKEFRDQFKIVWAEVSAEVSAAFSEVSAAFSELVVALQPVFDWLGKALIWLRDLLVSVFGPIVVGAVRNALTFIAADLRMVADVIRMIAALLKGDWSGAWEKAGSAASHGLKALRDLFFGRGDKPAAPVGRAPAPSPGSAAPATPAGSPGEQIKAFFRRAGLSEAATLGIAAGSWAESRHDPNAVNPTSGAYGIGQWLGSRKRELFKRYGPRPNLQQQLEFMLWELRGGDHGGRHVLGQSTAEGALDAYIRRFMRPAPGYETEGDLARGSQYLARQMRRPILAQPANAQGVSISQKTDIHVNGTGDAAAVAKNVAAEQGRVNGNLVRNTRGALS